MGRYDFTNTEEFAIAEEGDQSATLEKWEEKKSSKGNEQIVFELRTKNGGKLWHYCLTEDGKNWALKKFIHALTGQKPEKGPIDIDWDDYIGKSVKVNVFHDVWQGQKKAKISDVLLSGDDVPGSDKLLGEDLPF